LQAEEAPPGGPLRQAELGVAEVENAEPELGKPKRNPVAEPNSSARNPMKKPEVLLSPYQRIKT